MLRSAYSGCKTDDAIHSTSPCGSDGLPCRQLIRVGAQVDDHSLDIAIVARPISSRRLRSKFLMDESILAAVGNRHPLARQKSTSFRTLSEHTLIVRERGSRLREMIDEKFFELGKLPTQTIEVDDWQTAREFAANNLGCALLPESELTSTRRSTALKVQGLKACLPVYLVFRSDYANNGIVESFVDLIGE